jgi:hypothetical protein
VLNPFRSVASFPFVLCALASAQTALHNFDSLPRPALPSDPLELVTAAAVTVQTAEQRLAATTLLTHARDLSNVRAQPYELKTSFTTAGSLPSDGSWTMEDMSPGRAYRWTAQGPGYAVVNVYPQTTQGMLYSNQPAGVIPLRLEQVREAIFFVAPPMGPQASVRIASGYLNGAAQNCVLTMTGAGGRVFNGPRNWLEEEFCVDAMTGLLTTYSPAPGLYVRYDYTSAKQFHGKVFPGRFTITASGRMVVDARTESVSDPPADTSSLFNTAGLNAIGVGRVMNGGIRFHGFAGPGRTPSSGGTGASAVQVVTLHGNALPDGTLGELEILASSDQSLNQTALDRAKMQNTTRIGNRTQPGATPESEHIFFTWEFLQ